MKITKDRMIGAAVGGTVGFTGGYLLPLPVVAGLTVAACLIVSGLLLVGYGVSGLRRLGGRREAP